MWEPSRTHWWFLTNDVIKTCCSWQHMQAHLVLDSSLLKRCSQVTQAPGNHTWAATKYCHASMCNFCRVPLRLSHGASPSPVLLWTDSDNVMLLSVSNPLFDCLHQIFHYNRKLTNLWVVWTDRRQRVIFPSQHSTLISSQEFAVSLLCLWVTFHAILMGQSKK